MRNVVFALALLSCSDPVPDGQISALPAENPIIPVGEYHRAGQPCVLCHSPSGPASSSPFSVAGTIFAQPSSVSPVVGVDGATVAMTDATGSSFTVKTNCVGNFWVPRTGTGDGSPTWDPQFPIFVRAWDKTGARIDTMQGQIGRERSCANCHYDPNNKANPNEVYSAVTHVYLFGAMDMPPAPSTTCPVSPAIQ